MRNRRDVNRIVIQKILEYCNRIETVMVQFERSFDSYIKDEVFRHACDMCVIQIGELTTRLTDDLKAQHPEIQWHKIKATRNVYVHDYGNVNINKAWENLTENIPELKAQLEQILAAEGENENNDA